MRRSGFEREDAALPKLAGQGEEIQDPCKGIGAQVILARTDYSDIQFFSVCHADVYDTTSDEAPNWQNQNLVNME